MGPDLGRRHDVWSLLSLEMKGRLPQTPKVLVDAQGSFHDTAAVGN